MVAYATNGKGDKDGKVYRAAIVPHVALGITLEQAKSAVHIVANRTLVIPYGWDSHAVSSHLTAGRGLMIAGWYDQLPRAYRYQAYAHFTHMMWAAYISKTSGFRVWDPLNPDTTAYGRWIPANIMYAFAASLNYQVAYVPLEPI